MSDCISRQAAIDAMNRISDSICEQQAIDALCELPSAQPEIISTPSYTASVGEPMEYAPIVRCKDCKYYEIWQLKSDYTDDKRYKPSVCVKGQYAVHRNPDWFCADAERRTDE